jgi:transposase
MTNLQAAYIAQAVKALRKDSRFYADDKAAIVRAAKNKTPAQLREALNRQRAISQVSEREILVHCQV